MDKFAQLYGPLAIKVLGWVGAALGGALLVLLLNSSGDHRQVEINTKKLEALELRVEGNEQSYATNKRVDDVVAEMRASYVDLSAKMDQVIRLMLTRR